jgi:hypothetical protein
MALPTSYNTGTATVNANGTTVTGQGTSWLTSGLQAGDIFWAAGLSVRIAAVNSNTSLTLAYAWPGTTRSADVYEVRFASDATRALSAARQVLDALTNGNLFSIGALTTAANKLAYYTGAGVAALTDLVAHGRAIIGLTGGNGKFIRSTGPNTAVMQDIVGPVSQSGGIPTGAIVERGSNANGEYVRFADGTQICTYNAVFPITTSPVGSIHRDTAGVGAWSYPAAFAAAPAVSASAASNTAWTGVGSASASQVNSVPVFAPTALSGTSVRVYFMAIGRWF